MKSLLLAALQMTVALALAPVLPLAAGAQVIINEADTATPSARGLYSDEYEFIELYDSGTGGIDLTGMVLVVYNSTATVKDSWDLDGYSTDAGGYFVIGDKYVVNADWLLEWTNLIDDELGAVALYTGDDTDFPQSSALTTTGLIDAVVFSNNATLLTLLNGGQTEVAEDGGGDLHGHSLQRVPNGSGGARNTASYTTMPPTPGFANGPYTPVVRDVCPSGCTYSSIGAAVADSFHGDEITVGDGTYFENIDYGGREITIRSLNGPAKTIINGSAAGSVVMLILAEGDEAVLDGFTITNGTGYDLNDWGTTNGGGIVMRESNATIRNCIVTGNSVTDSGGGIRTAYSSPRIYNTVISGNSAVTFGGGVAFADECGSGCDDTLFYNSVISGNTADDGAGISLRWVTGMRILNITVSGNMAADDGGGIECFSGGELFMFNSILAGNVASFPDRNEFYDNNCESYIAYSNIQGGDPGLPGYSWPGVGNLDADPLFIDPQPAASAPTSLGNYGLLPNSPSVDSGTDYIINYPDLPTDDFYGRARPQGSGHDMGAYEHVFGGDWDADGKPDLLWRNHDNGANYLWYMDGPALTGGASIPMVGNTDWTVGATADFDIDGKPDILWRNTATGANYLWYMDGPAMDGGEAVAPAGTAWALAGAADFDLDDRPDLLWRNMSNGRNFIWYMDGALPVSSEAIPTADPAWSVASIDDFNADGRPDLLWRNGGSGANLLWYLDGTVVTGTAPLPPVGTAWSPDGTADFNGDGDPDVCWRNYSTGETYLWYMSGASITGGELLPQVNDTDWHIEQ